MTGGIDYYGMNYSKIENDNRAHEKLCSGGGAKNVSGSKKVQMGVHSWNRTENPGNGSKCRPWILFDFFFPSQKHVTKWLKFVESFCGNVKINMLRDILRAEM